MTVRASFAGALTLVETLTGAFVLTSDNTVTLQMGNAALTLNGTTTPSVTKGTIFSKALASGVGTIDLTALPGLTAEETVNGTGLKVVLAVFQNPATNAGDITVTFGAANPYLLLGAGFLFKLKPGQLMPLYLLALAPTIGSGAKNVDISGTGTEALNVGLAMG
jgi:hypothetical protein